MLAKVALLALCATSALANVAQVHEHITNEHCLVNYIRKSAPACVANGNCFPHGTEAANGCKNIKKWQWQDHSPGGRSYAPGVLPPAHQRKTHLGSDARKVVWAYTGSIRQGLAYEVYGPKGQVTDEQLLNTPCNQISFIANVLVNKSTDWFRPGINDTDGCGQMQTVELPFGFNGSKPGGSPEFAENLGKLKANGVTITLTMGSWCTSFPVKPEQEWSNADFSAFVKYFEHVDSEYFGGHLDGIDFDWEGFCGTTCLKEFCDCAWDDDKCGSQTPAALARGVFWDVVDDYGHKRTKQCWVMPTESTMQVITGITAYMRDAGHVVTLVPMSTAMYTGDADTTPNQVMRNEYAKWNKHNINGKEEDVLARTDGILLQWYSGFDASLCKNSKDPKACTCDNIQLDNYPNVYNTTKDGMVDFYYNKNGVGGNMFPTSFPVRCQACGKNVILKNGSKGEFPCAPKGEDWFQAANTTEHPDVLRDHKTHYKNYSVTHKTIPYWWVKDLEINSKCPRSIDCPDWRYEGEEPYSRQMTLLKSLGKIVDLSKVSIGFETLGTDVQVQMEAWEDPALPWSNVKKEDKWNKGIYFNKCTQNLTMADIAAYNPAIINKSQKRCGQPVMESQWGLKMNATELFGLEDAVLKETGKELAGIGVFTLDGMLWQPRGKPTRLWYPELCKINTKFGLTCNGGQKCCTDLPDPSTDCTGCIAGTSGPCKVPTVNVCSSKVNGQCPSGTVECKPSARKAITIQ